MRQSAVCDGLIEAAILGAGGQVDKNREKMHLACQNKLGTATFIFCTNNRGRVSPYGCPSCAVHGLLANTLKNLLVYEFLRNVRVSRDSRDRDRRDRDKERDRRRER